MAGLLLRTGVPPDFLDEDALEEPAQLRHYRAIFVTEPNVPAAGTAGLLAWVNDGGHLLTVSNAMVADAFDTPSAALEAASGIKEPKRQRLALWSDSSLKIAANGTLTLDAEGIAFVAYGVHANLSVVPSGQRPSDGSEILGHFADGGAALARSPVGSHGGSATRFGFMPGISYWFSGRAAAARVRLSAFCHAAVSLSR